LHLNKKGWEIGLVGKLIVLILSLLLILGVIKLIASKADVNTGLSMCRASLALKEHSNVGIEDNWVTGDLLNYDLAPLLCKTFDLKFPEGEYATMKDKKEAVTKNIAERTADCWWQFGEGIVDNNVFGKNIGWAKNRCFICYTFSTKSLKDGEVISAEEIYDYMAMNPYKAISADRPVCGSKEAEELGPEGKTNCIDKDTPECERKGGDCREYCSVTSEIEFSEWSCPKGGKCCVIGENAISYIDYVYFEKGNGVIQPSDTIVANGVTNKQTYAIAFISQTTDTGWAMIDLASWFIPYGSIFKLGGKLVAKGATKVIANAVPEAKIVKLVVKGGTKTVGEIVAKTSTEAATKAVSNAITRVAPRYGAIVAQDAVLLERMGKETTELALKKLAEKPATELTESVVNDIVKASAKEVSEQWSKAYITNNMKTALGMTDFLKAGEEVSTEAATQLSKWYTNRYVMTAGTVGTTRTIEGSEDLINEFVSGSPQVLLIAPLDEIDKRCNLQKDVGQE
jgi:hypothetical protein